MPEQDDLHPCPEAAGEAAVVRAPRDSVFLAAQILCPVRQPIGCRVRNISATGMMVECAARVEAGDELKVTLRGIGEVGCTVARVRSGILGLRFHAPIDPELCRKSVLARPRNDSTDWTLHLREPFKTPRWENAQTSRPKLR